MHVAVSAVVVLLLSLLSSAMPNVTCWCCCGSVAPCDFNRLKNSGLLVSNNVLAFGFNEWSHPGSANNCANVQHISSNDMDGDHDSLNVLMHTLPLDGSMLGCRVPWYSLHSTIVGAENGKSVGKVTSK